MRSFKEIIKPLGLVFGDIGTSPIYTLTVVFALIPATFSNILGVLSLIVWTLTLLVFVQYAWLAMSLSKKGEGGTIVLKEILVPLLQKKWHITIVTVLAFVGISFLIGDGVITPAISILSAVEGLRFIPQFVHINQVFLLIFASLIALGLFMFQRRGAETVSGAFGPLMLIWFVILSVLGIFWIGEAPLVLYAINPYYACSFFYQNGAIGFLVLAKIILCATGSEALYADMGHLGRKPIMRAWIFVFCALVLTYLGQGAFLMQHQSSKQIFYDMMYTQMQPLYVPFLVLSIMATVIASQAMISGIFSVVYQGIMTNIFPRLQIDYTSRMLKSQIYIPFVNRFLCVFVLLAIWSFKESYNLANAYGLAASATMTITAFMITWIFYRSKIWFKFYIAFLILGINTVFLVSTTTKILYGAYWSLCIALIPLSIILIYTAGKKKLYASLKPIERKSFINTYEEMSQKITKIQGTALFFTKHVRKIPSYIAHTMFINTIIYEDNILVSVITDENPFGINASFKEELAIGLRIFEIHVGYMEIVDLEQILTHAGIVPKVIFYGLEDIATINPLWHLFAIIKKLTPSFVQFHKLPFDKLHGVMMQVRM